MNAKKAPFQWMAEERSTTPGERIHSDVKELPSRSIEGYIYAVCFVDDATRRCVVYPLKKKSEVITRLEQFLLEECAARGRAVRYLRSDHGGEYDSEEMSLFCSTRGIWQEMSPPHCQSANGVAEVAWRDTFRMVRTILYDQHKPPKYWAIALRFATYLRNHLMTHAVQDRPPESAWTGKKVNLSHLRVPLSTCYAYIEKNNRKDTLGPRRMKGVFVGYATHSPAYLVLSEDNGRVYERRYDDVKFVEDLKETEQEAVDSEDAKQLDAFFDALEEQTELDAQQLNAHDKQKDTVESPEPPQPSTPPRTENPATDPEEDVKWYRITRDLKVKQVAAMFNEQAKTYLERLREYEGWYQQLTCEDSIILKGSDVPIPPAAAPPTVRVTRNRKRRVSVAFQGVEIEASRAVHRSLLGKRRDRAEMAMQVREQELCALWHHHALEVLTAPDPKSVKAAMKSKDAAEWTTAMKKEWRGLWDKQAFEKVKRTTQKLHNMLWVFKRKSDGTYKARLCFDGRRQDPSTYDNIASPTMKLTSLRILLAIAAQRDWPVWADDAAQAFLNAPRPENKPLYASYPEGFRSERGDDCLLVKRMLYGLHDAPMGWFLEVRKHLVEEQGFRQSRADACLFHKPGCFVVCHVDDFASTGEPETVAEFRRKLHERFKMTGGKITEYYGLEVKQDLRAHKIELSCEKYLSKALVRLGLKPKAWDTPMEAHLVLPRRRADEKPDKQLQKKYRQLVGTVMHPSVTCRPDVTAAVRALSVHLQNPDKRHVSAAERVLQYLHHTRKFRLTWTKQESLESSFFGTCDAAHNVTHDAKGITGWAYQLGLGAVSWKCRAQGLTALSSTEAELIAVDDAAREAQFLHKLLQDFGIRVSDHLPTCIRQDNQSTIKLIHSDHWNARTKHVALRYHHTGDLVKDGILNIEYLNTEAMPADLLTKPLPTKSHHRHRAVLLGHTPLE